ncbi:glycosyltransferase family protein [Marinicrinis lubricantis]|uniref:Glycosyltransferase n=1 Tax=Marinicrinis lubricantis TaxID=2086470 RepID=A0ABW1IUE1_9BACL
MRILCMLNLDIFRLSMGWALEALGHDVYHMNIIDEQRLEQAIRLHRPDFFFDMGWDGQHLNWDNLNMMRETLKRHGVYHVYFAEEDSLHYDNWSQKYVQTTKPDFVLTRGWECVERYKEQGYRSAYLDVGCNPDFHRPVEAQPDLMCDVSVVCNGQFIWDIYRRKSIHDLVVPLFDGPFHVQIWGRDWENAAEYYGKTPNPGVHRGKLEFHRTPQAYSSAKINISVQSMDDQLSNRTLDILSTGGFLLTSNTSAVRTKLLPGVCCAVSDSPEETLEQIQYYLTHEDDRSRIAAAGMQLAREHLSYQATLPFVLEQVQQAINERGGVNP